MSVTPLEELKKQYPNIISLEPLENERRIIYTKDGSRIIIPPKNHVRKKGNKQELLGDRIERYLQSINVTEENYKAAKVALGVGFDCNCTDRKQIINKVHEYAKEYGWLQAAKEALNIRNQHYADKTERDKP